MADFGFEYWKRVDELKGNMSILEMSKKLGLNYKTLRNMRSENRYPKQDDSRRIAELLNTTVDYLISGDRKDPISSYCDEAQFVQDNPEARALVRAIMDDPSLLYPLSALVGRKSPEAKEKEA